MLVSAQGLQPRSQDPLLSVPRGREGEDPGNQVARIIVSAHGQEPDMDQ